MVSIEDKIKKKIKISKHVIKKMFQKQLNDIIFKKKALYGGSNPQQPNQQPPNDEVFRPSNRNNFNEIQNARRIQELRSQLAALRFQLRSQPNNEHILNQIAIIEQELGILNIYPQEN